MPKKKSGIVKSTVPAHPMLLALVAQFLESHGFNSSHRILNTERKKRPKKGDWQKVFARSYTAKYPSLDRIFEVWHKENFKDESDSSDEDNDSSPVKSAKSNETSIRKDIEPLGSIPAISGPARSLKRKASETSSVSQSSSASGSSDSESEDKSDDVPPVKKQKLQPSSSSTNTDEDGDSDSSSASDSSSHAEEAASKSDSSSSSEADSASESESESESDSDSESESEPSVQDKILKTAVKTKLPSSGESSSDDSSDSEESSDSDDDSTNEEIPAIDKAASDSSGTIVGDVKISRSLSDSSASEAAVEVTEIAITKKKHIGAQPTKLAALSAIANANDYISNDYVSYDYADKAYRDLSITRGKGFTKEKNKKKRGSYRGGAIDTSGGKGFKFED